ncbi:MAG: sigma-70 family RNA polymerase sigma factor [Candidatus Omnitrophica bacterium]|nr:sigma-70 family RNA polymerase sigma factor [Candidatus Omnitrophota bacterium]
MDDLDFVQRCVKADKIAWEEFLQKYCRLIYSYINSIIRIKGHVFEPSVVEEIFHEIIASLIQNNFKKLKTYRGKNKASLASWLRQVTINFSLDYLRKNKYSLVSIDEPMQGELTLSEIIPYRSLSASEELVKKEKAETLTDCIQRLDLDDKLFLELNIRMGLSLEDLKNFFRVSRGVIDMRRSRIIERLKDCFKGKGFVLPE